MATDNGPGAGQGGGRAAYHHGDLREALIAATRELVRERGAEHFSLADACRRAGVSTAAPYRHFRDKQAVLAEVTARGFEALTARFHAAIARHGEGTQGAISAMGQAYVAFAIEQPALFRLMFGQQPELKESPRVQDCGHGCFGTLVAQTALYCERNGLSGDVLGTAVQLWTFVHGASSLAIDRDYDNVAPELDINAMIEAVTPRLLARG